ncbi:MAG: DNA repair and recombination protein RadB [Candidatus Pacearchaeota archaeon]
MKELRISSGNYDLNKFLYGGYETDIITTIYGPAGSGKTNLCILASVSQAKKRKKVIFIDTEGGFSIDRFKQISGENHEGFLKNIFLLKPSSFNEQKLAFETLLKELKRNSNIGLVIVDGMTMLYRLELSRKRDGNKDDVLFLNKELAMQMKILAEISRKKSIPVITTNQIYYSFLSEEEWRERKPREVNLVAGDVIKYWSKCLIELKNENGKRTLILRKHRSLPEKDMQFIITNYGIKKRGFLI